MNYVNKDRSLSDFNLMKPFLLNDYQKVSNT